MRIIGLSSDVCSSDLLSSTGVYGDTGGAWVDETAPVGTGRRSARAKADLAWQALRPDVRIFRLPGIYGPGRNVLDRIRDGKAHRIDLPGQVFSRIHVDDIVRSEEHTSELQSLMRISYAVFCLKKKKIN